MPLHFIWVFTVCHSTLLLDTNPARVKCGTIFSSPIIKNANNFKRLVENMITILSADTITGPFKGFKDMVT